MLRFSYLVFLTAVAIAAGLAIHFQSTSATAGLTGYIGARNCAPCHTARSDGQITQVWNEGPHPEAYAALQSDMAVSFLHDHSELNIADCLGCHTTGGFEPHDYSDSLLLNEGVGCERCHGPGRAYANAATMIDSVRFVLAGGSTGSFEDCSGCHRITGQDSDGPGCPVDTGSIDPVAAWKLMGHGGNYDSIAQQTKLERQLRRLLEPDSLTRN